MATILMELQDLLNNLQFESQHTEAVKIITKYLRKRAVQRLDETTQALRLKEAYDSGDANKVREFSLSQFGRIRQQAENFAHRIEDDSNRPEQVRAKHLPAPETASCEQSN